MIAQSRAVILVGMAQKKCVYKRAAIAVVLETLSQLACHIGSRICWVVGSLAYVDVDQQCSDPGISQAH
ncbi:hypothetical protein AXX00_25885 [Pseudomonas aeruginosa]|nr:hypothetical protein BMR72_21130 [Pseudomonas aeruginosa]OFQ71310.1 hypothetical protein HMPREF2924_24870 [Pseudomonas sp. HMSC063H08]OFQ95487.1 hypothetical protein HMPREF2914_17365 [Pseudomonas sp. HMSC067G02]RIZ25926.1 hypothetical protein AXX00_25885 [Pseudomonas aeruginosa]